MKEFEEAYAKSAGGFEQAKDDSISKLKNFLDLYVNFKMKLRDAEVRGFESDQSLTNELIDYKKKVGVTYLLEKQVVEPGVRDLYEKRKLEYRVSHLMIRPDSSGVDAARELAQSILDSIKAGADYEEMVEEYSDDTYSKNLGGDIYYVTAGQLPTEFEDAMYATEPGQVYPEVVETKFGFHIIKVTEKQPRVPSIRASHILISFQNEEGQLDTVAAKAKIDSLAERIKAGEDFAKLAEEYSADGSKQQGGDLGYFKRRDMVKEFDEAAFKLEVGEVSDVVKTQYGYHLIKLTDKKSYASFEEEKEGLKNLFKQIRYQAVYDELVNSLKEKYNLTINEETINKLASSLDSVRVGSEYNNIDELRDLPVFTYAGKNLYAGDFLEQMETKPEFQNRIITKSLLEDAANKLGGDIALEEEALNLDKTNPEFASLMEDYKNGIYIFKLQEDEVWNKIKIDSAKLHHHYLETKDNYVWNDRVDFSEIFSKKDSLINYYYSLLENGEVFDSVASKYTERPGYKEKAGSFGLVDANSSTLAEAANKLKKPGDYTKPFATTGGFSIIKLNAKEPSRLKTFEEAKAEVSGSYQETESKRLDQAYIESLKKRYEPEYHYEELEKAFSDTTTISAPLVENKSN